MASTSADQAIHFNNPANTPENLAGKSAEEILAIVCGPDAVLVPAQRRQLQPLVRTDTEADVHQSLGNGHYLSLKNDRIDEGAFHRTRREIERAKRKADRAREARAEAQRQRRFARQINRERERALARELEPKPAAIVAASRALQAAIESLRADVAAGKLAPGAVAKADIQAAIAAYESREIDASKPSTSAASAVSSLWDAVVSVFTGKRKRAQDEDGSAATKRRVVEPQEEAEYRVLEVTPTMPGSLDSIPHDERELPAPPVERPVAGTKRVRKIKRARFADTLAVTPDGSIWPPYEHSTTTTLAAIDPQVLADAVARLNDAIVAHIVAVVARDSVLRATKTRRGTRGGEEKRDHAMDEDEEVHE